MTRKFDPQSGFQTGPRVKKFLDSKGIKIAELQNKTKIDRSQISRSFNQQTDLGTMSLEKIANAFPELSIQWVVTGKGKMLIGEDLSHNEKEIIQLYQDLESKVDRDLFFIQSMFFKTELLERKILTGSFEELSAEISEENRPKLLRRLKEILLGMQQKRREIAFSYFEKNRAFEEMGSKGEPYSGQLGAMVRKEDWMKRFTELIKMHILLETDSAKNMIEEHKGE